MALESVDSPLRQCPTGRSGLRPHLPRFPPISKRSDNMLPRKCPHKTSDSPRPSRTFFASQQPGIFFAYIFSLTYSAIR